MENILRELREKSISVRTNEPLSLHSSFRIGGPAAVAAFPQNAAELITLLCTVKEACVPFAVLGKGSNVLFSDRGFSGVVVFTTQMRELSVKGRCIRASAGVPLSVLAMAARDAALTGAEFAHGIPGTLGGAVFMNAGAYGEAMEGILRSSRYFDTVTQKIEEISASEHAFGYRTSAYETHPERILLEATLELSPGDPESIRVRMAELAAKRRSSQPLEYPNAGSVFKRPQGYFAGKLIEDCGWKGRGVGGAEVSSKHAGFIVNRGGATAQDVLELIRQIKESVKERFGVSLECEIRCVGDF